MCKRTSGTRHWMPTREAQFLKQLDPATIPPNLIIRMSSHMIDQGPVKFWPWTSTVTSQEGRTCPAPEQGNSAAAVDSAGTGPHQTCVTVNINGYSKKTPKILRCAQEDPGRELTSSQASGGKHPNQRSRVQASSQSHKLQDLMTRVQAHKPKSGAQATRIKVFSVCFTWKLIWWGEKRIL